MTATRSRRPSASLVVSVAALVLATGSTSYAAGLARNSVGNAQLRTDAVTGSKVQDRSLTGADLKDASIGPADLSPGASAPRDIVVVRDLGDTDGPTTLLTTPDFVLTADCDPDNNAIDVQAQDPAGAFNVRVYGITSNVTGSTSTTGVVNNGVLQVIATTPEGLTGLTGFEGSLRNGTRPWLHVSAQSIIETSQANDVCRVRFVATPGR